MARRAFEDPLTGLGNRASLTSHLDTARRRAALDGSTLAMLIIDLDDFKKINDSLSQGAGDVLLVEFADRLRGCLRSSDVAVRVGGDEFAVLVEAAGDDHAILTAEAILAAAGLPFFVADQEVAIGASIGIALSEAGEDDHKLLRAADLAMYGAKSRGKGRHAVFEPGMHVAALGRLALESDLRRAVARGVWISVGGRSQRPVEAPDSGTR